MEFNFKKSLFNLDLLVLTKEHTKKMTPVSKLNVFESSSTNFEVSGLFSTDIFGAVGSTDRNERFSYIDLKVKVLHPLVYKHLTTTRAFYKEVLAGRKYGVYDPKLKDLVPSVEGEGGTGYSFFMETLDNIEMLDNDSDLRKFKLHMIANHSSPEFMLKELLVIPAGLRDYTVDESGVPSEDEINDKYRKVMMLANTLDNITLSKETIGAIDSVRFRIQEGVLDLYDHIMGLLDGKRKFIQGKWGSRGTLYGTRNVITPSLANVTNLDSPNNLTIDHTTIGLFQYARAITPITMNKLHMVFISKIFNPDSNAAYLVNPKSMKTELVDVPVKIRDSWLTLDGLDDMLATMGQDDLRAEPVMVNGNYMLLLHDNGKVITPVFNTDNLPEEFKESNLRPISYYELLYIALIDTYDTYRGLITRYPVINLGGVYPTKYYIKTTDNPRVVSVVINNKTTEVVEYPNFKEPYYNSLSPHYAFLRALGGDYDGDEI
ncbi:MAG: hypothetical protein Q9M19_01080 [Mariprofundaceae bacterium]|nr:hypothetical protein [Mariprofundaceae bacterium]